MDLLLYPFFRNALLGVVLISLASAIVGTYIVTRRMVFISGGITHACFGGLGLGYFLGISPMLMAAVFAIGGSLGVDWFARRRARRDSAIAVIWAFGMAIGVLFVFLSSGYAPELNSFLFGNVLTITTTDLWLFAALLIVLVAVYAVAYRAIIAVSFDPDFAATRRLPVRLINTVLTILLAVCIVLTIRMIGIMMLMSVLSLPQLTAELFTRSYGRMMLLSGIISLAGCVGGLFAAYAISVPASAAIVLLLVALYALAALLRPLRKALRRGAGF